MAHFRNTQFPATSLSNSLGGKAIRWRLDSNRGFAFIDGVKTILTEVQGSNFVIRLNRPHRLNAVTEALYEELSGALDLAQQDPSIRSVTLAGEGRAFCVGADLKEHGHGGRTVAQKQAYAKKEQEICLRLQTLDKPCLAAVHGYALGAGAEIALSCDFVIMVRDAQLGFPEIALGTFIGGGLTATLPMLVGLKRAKELVLLGQRIAGDEAERLGLVFKAVRHDRLWHEVEALASDLAAKAPIPMAMAKRQLRQNGRLTIEEVMNLESNSLFECMTTSDWVEGIRSFEEKRKPQFKGK